MKGLQEELVSDHAIVGKPIFIDGKYGRKKEINKGWLCS